MEIGMETYSGTNSCRVDIRLCRLVYKNFIYIEISFFVKRPLFILEKKKKRYYIFIY